MTETQEIPPVWNSPGPVDEAAAPRLRMPAEWERHEATWIGWPQNVSDWPGKFAPIPWVYAEIARKIIPGETLRILVNSAREEARAKRALRRAG
ncbi:MAG: agmatine deiminase family protein, partial [Terriglobia bacterium]